MLDHGLEQPALSTDAGYFQFTLLDGARTSTVFELLRVSSARYIPKEVRST